MLHGARYGPVLLLFPPASVWALGSALRARRDRRGKKKEAIRDRLQAGSISRTHYTHLYIRIKGMAGSGVRSGEPIVRSAHPGLKRYAVYLLIEAGWRPAVGDRRWAATSIFKSRVLGKRELLRSDDEDEPGSALKAVGLRNECSAKNRKGRSSFLAGSSASRAVCWGVT